MSSNIGAPLVNHSFDLSFLRHRYYDIKPHLPVSLRMALRQRLAARTLKRSTSIWPINPAASHKPEGWRGWPHGKQFGLILTHDVEGSAGLAKCRDLMELEQDLGFRSSFNFIPEGEYTTPSDLREELVANGFEVGVHDLRHDGKLYRSRKEFQKAAERINSYLKEWRAVGFRSGFMHHNLEWLHALNIGYDMSTFDTDPFEPQPDGVHTIFPFWISANGNGAGYVEMPYTLPQDFTLFRLLKEGGIDTWKRKVDWIAEHGGMVLVNTHPDYMNFGKEAGDGSEYPAGWYRELLTYIKSKYAGAYWAALPREVVAHVRKDKMKEYRRVGSSDSHELGRGRKVWIDLDNTPHVPFFRPIIRELETRGYKVVLSARDAFQVCELADQAKLPYARIGQHYGKSRVLKVIGLLLRALQLLPFALREKPAIGLSHGSRSQMFICNLLRIPTVLIMDYEHAKNPPLARPDWEIVPKAVPVDSLYARKERVRQYSGIKEDVYAAEFTPNASLLGVLGLDGPGIVVTVRPPATEAHYHNPESETLFVHFMNRVMKIDGIKTVLLPRNKRQESALRQEWPQWFSGSKVTVPKSAVDGLNLLWHSDLVVSGGGTMNREAAALGVPVYSIFRGPIGAVDKTLQKEGRLTLITSTLDVDQKILLRRREKALAQTSKQREALADIIRHVEDIIRIEAKARP